MLWPVRWVKNSPKPACADDGAGGVVGLPAGDGGWSAAKACFDDGDGGIAGVADGVEDALLAVGGFAADDAGPGDVVMDG